ADPRDLVRLAQLRPRHRRPDDRHRARFRSPHRRRDRPHPPRPRARRDHGALELVDARWPRPPPAASATGPRGGPGCRVNELMPDRPPGNTPVMRLTPEGRRFLSALLAVLIFVFALVYSNVAANHAPKPRDLPIGVIGPQATV